MASPNTPAISFLMPYRWFNEDKAFLGENLVRMITSAVGRKPEDLAILENILSYRIVIAYRFKEPVDITITKTALQRMLKKAFPNAKCLSVQVQYFQANNYPLPTCDFQIFF